VKEPGTGKSVEEVSQNRYYSVRLYLILHDVSKKTIADIFSRNVSNHYTILVIFGVNVTKKFAKEKSDDFLTLPNLLQLHYHVKH